MIRAKYSVLVEVVASRHYVPGIKVCRVYGHGIRHSLLYVEDGLPPVPDSVETDVSRVLGISALGLVTTMLKISCVTVTCHCKSLTTVQDIVSLLCVGMCIVTRRQGYNVFYLYCFNYSVLSSGVQLQINVVNTIVTVMHFNVRQP